MSRMFLKTRFALLLLSVCNPCLSRADVAEAEEVLFPAFVQLVQEGEGLDEQVRQVHRQARENHSAEIRSLEFQIQSWKSRIEEALTDSKLPLNLKARGVQSYLGFLPKLVSIHIALHLDHDATWLHSLAIRIPKSIASQIQGWKDVSQGRFHEKFLKWSFSPSTRNPDEFYEVTLSQSSVHGIELELLSSEPGRENLQILLQYMAARQLIHNLAEIERLQGRHISIETSIPILLKEKFPTLKNVRQLLDDERLIADEMWIRFSLGKTLQDPDEFSKLPDFVDAELFALFKGILSKKLKSELLAIEKKRSLERITQAIRELEIPLLQLSPREQVALLAEEIAEAKRQSLIETLLAKLEKNELNLSYEDRVRIEELSAQKKVEYSKRISSSLLSQWLEQAEAPIRQASAGKRKKNLLIQLRDAYQSLNSKTMEMSVLQVLAESRYSHSTENWRKNLNSIFGPGSKTYLDAQKKYVELVTQLTSSKVTSRGRLIPSLVERYLAAKPSTTNEIEDRSRKFENQEIVDLLHIGELVGFHRDYQGQEPTLKDISPTRKWKAQYQKIYREETLTRYPLIKPLESILRKLPTEGELTPETLGELLPELDEALSQTARKELIELESIAHYNSEKELRTLIQSGVVLASLLGSFPEFQLEKDAWLSETLSPTLPDQILHHYMEPLIRWGMVALILIDLSPMTGKKLAVIAKLAAYRKPLIYSLASGFSAKLAYQYRMASDSKRRLDHVQAIPELYLENQRENIEAQSSQAVRAYWLELSVDSLFLAFPIYHRFFKGTEIQTQ